MTDLAEGRAEQDIERAEPNHGGRELELEQVRGGGVEVGAELAHHVVVEVLVGGEEPTVGR